MFEANTALSVSETDFDTLKSSFKEFVKNKTEFKDYDFEGSTLNQVLNILAYHSYMNSFYTNMAVNEGYLDTAQVRSNVVSNAKKLGYVPQSARSSTAQIIVRFSPQDIPSSLLIPAYSQFRGKKDGIDYFFYNRDQYEVLPTDDFIYEQLIEIFEGTPVTQTFNFDPATKFYEISNKNIDLDSLVVQIKETANSTTVKRYTRVEDITTLTRDSLSFFIQENYREKYEIYFGDGVIGKALENGNVIEMIYQTNSAEEPNGIKKFDSIGFAGIDGEGLTSYAVSNITLGEAARDGFGKEGTESVRFNSRHYHNIQNRFVTVNDYVYFLKNEYPFIESIQVWGGEDHIPPVYGKVIISIKPSDGYVLSDQSKDAMAAKLQERNVLTIEPIFVDPIYLYVSANITVRYDSKKTTLDKESLYTKIQTKVQNFEENNLSDFLKFFQYSTFVTAIDTADASIESTETSILLEKRFAPVLESNLSYKIQFTNQLKNPFQGYQGCLTSTAFMTNTNSNWLYFDDDGYGKVRTYYKNANNELVYVNNNAGTINYRTGEVKLTSIKIMTYNGDYIKFTAQPANMNYYPLKNQIILLSFPKLTMFDTSVNQLVKSDILDVNGNISSVDSDSIDVPVIF